MGMGGAGVAVTRGALSTYWNPAALSPPRRPSTDSFFDLTLPVGINYAATRDILRELDDVVDLVSDTDFDEIERKLEAGEMLTDEELGQITRLVEELPDIDKPGTGLVADASAGLNLRIGPVGLSALGILRAGGLTNLDTSLLALGNRGLGDVIDTTAGNTPGTADGQALADLLVSEGLASRAEADEIAFQAEQAGVDVASGEFQDLLEDVLRTTGVNDGGSVEDIFTSNASGIDLRGFLLQEYALGYSQPFFGLVSAGAAVKLLHGTTFFKPFTLRSLEGFDVIDEVLDEENREESFNFGIDLGVLAQPLDWLSVGLLARNINRPKFDFAGPGDYVLEPQVRAGAGVLVPGGFTLAADLDLIENESEILPGRRSQVIGAGVEWNGWDTLFLRGGVSKNFAESDEDLALHAGLGLRFFTVSIEAAAVVVPDFTEIDTGNGGSPTKVPERAGASLLISVNVPLD